MELLYNAAIRQTTELLDQGAIRQWSYYTMELLDNGAIIQLDNGATYKINNGAFNIQWTLKLSDNEAIRQ